jgi:hypothetical protein
MTGRYRSGTYESGIPYFQHYLVAVGNGRDPTYRIRFPLALPRLVCRTTLLIRVCRLVVEVFVNPECYCSTAGGNGSVKPLALPHPGQIACPPAPLNQPAVLLTSKAIPGVELEHFVRPTWLGAVQFALSH